MSLQSRYSTEGKRARGDELRKDPWRSSRRSPSSGPELVAVQQHLETTAGQYEQSQAHLTHCAQTLYRLQTALVSDDGCAARLQCGDSPRSSQAAAEGAARRGPARARHAGRAHHGVGGLRYRQGRGGGDESPDAAAGAAGRAADPARGDCARATAVTAPGTLAARPAPPRVGG